MQHAGVTGFKLAAALQTSELFMGPDTAATELIARTAAAKATPIATLDMMSSLLALLPDAPQLALRIFVCSALAAPVADSNSGSRSSIDATSAR